jgi:hypothetical protein
MLAGIDADGGIAWRRPLGFISGSFVLQEVVLGASPEGIVLSNLGVIAPQTGEALFAAPTHPVGSEQRPVPDVSLTGSALFVPGGQLFLHFEADVTLLHRRGGLWLLEPRPGAEN